MAELEAKATFALACSDRFLRKITAGARAQRNSASLNIIALNDMLKRSRDWHLGTPRQQQEQRDSDRS